jgi:hypothetical protein
LYEKKVLTAEEATSKLFLRTKLTATLVLNEAGTYTKKIMVRS